MATYTEVFQELESLGVIGDVDTTASDPDAPVAPAPVAAAHRPVPRQEVRQEAASPQTEREPNHDKMVVLCDKAIGTLDSFGKMVADLKELFVEMRQGWKQDREADKN